MLIHFIASKSNLDKEIDNYRKIVDIIQKQGHKLTRNWIEGAYKIAQEGDGFKNLDWDSIYAENMEALARADLVIAEATTKSFAVGFQTAVALQHKKPTLLLQREEVKEKTFYPATAKDNLLVHHIYDDTTLEKIVEDFLKENMIDSKDLRFNFFIDRKIYNYLRWAAFKTGKTKAEILRDLVQNEIEKQDYQS